MNDLDKKPQDPDKEMVQEVIPTYQPPLESVCPTCGNKTIGSCPRQECKNG